MKESVQQFERRTGVRYEPSPRLLGLGRPLIPADEVPTLFRFPSAAALQALITGGLGRLAPPDRDGVFLARDVAGTARPGAASAFGLAVCLEPLRLQPVLTPAGELLGLNRELQADEVAWAPPGALHRPPDWDRVRTADELRESLGASWAAERRRVLDALGAYLEETSELARAGVEPPEQPWSETPRESRSELLRRAGIRGRWTALD